MTLDEWAQLDEEVEGELVDGILEEEEMPSLEVYELSRDGHYTVALTAGEGRARIPGCPGLRLDLDALWNEVDEAERARVRVARRR